MSVSFDLIESLIQQKRLSKTDADRIQNDAKRRGVDVELVLNESGVVAEDDIVALKAKATGLPSKLFAKDEAVPKEVLSLIPQESARFYQMMCFAKDKSTMSVGMVHPENTKAQDALQFIAQGLGVTLKFFVIRYSDWTRFVSGYSSFGEAIAASLSSLKGQQQEKNYMPGHVTISFDNMQSIKSEETPIIKIVSDIMRHGISEHASDIHIEPEPARVRVRYRIDGDLASALYLPLEVHQAILSRIKIMANIKIDETRVPQDGRFSGMVDGKQIDFRVATFPTANGEKVAIRILDPSVGLMSLEELGFSPWNFEKAKLALKKPFGMILVTGPTGSGKSTTLYAMLQAMNQDGVNIVTLEDPIEYFVPGINQSQVIPEIGYTFGFGLRSILRQDPNVVMVGEIRDQETAELAVHAALTGHVMLSTLHTNNALGTVPRLIDLQVQRFLIPSTLNIIISQRLVRKLCDNCKKPVQASGEAEKAIIDALSALPEDIKAQLPYKKPYTLYEPVGCDVCKGKGTKGRLGVYELLVMTPEMESLILSGTSDAKLPDEARRQGMTTMRQEGVLQALAGKISFAEVVKETA